MVEVPADLPHAERPETERSAAMWDTPETSEVHLSHDPPCARCGHARHTYLACSDHCDCAPLPAPGSRVLVA